ncbi:MAG: hypothetical protein AMXMBFR64_45490 [Myxococcales bacterium]
MEVIGSGSWGALVRVRNTHRRFGQVGWADVAARGGAGGGVGGVIEVHDPSSRVVGVEALGTRLERIQQGS